MNRVTSLGLFLLFALGCAAAADRQALRPLPEDGPPTPYADLLSRARQQAMLADEAFMINNWTELDDAAKGLEQTARFLAKSTDVPPKHKDALPVVAGDLGKVASEVRECVKTKDVNKTNEAMKRVQLTVRQLRLDD
jgi:hypothetical protein